MYRLTNHLLPHTVAPRVTSLYRTSSTTNLTLTCTSTNSPATTVTWMKDGDTLDIDGVKYKTYQTVTDRRTSTYENTLLVDDDIENITGSYTCRVSNKLGSSSRDLTVRGTLLGNWLNVKLKVLLCTPLVNTFWKTVVVHFNVYFVGHEFHLCYGQFLLTFSSPRGCDWHQLHSTWGGLPATILQSSIICHPDLQSCGCNWSNKISLDLNM